MNIFGAKYAPYAVLYARPTSDDPNPAVLAGLLELQAKLGDGPYLMGNQWTIAECAVAPFFIRMLRAKETDLGFLGEKKGKELLQALEDPKYAKINAYIDAVASRQSVQKTFPPVSISISSYLRTFKTVICDFRNSSTPLSKTFCPVPIRSRTSLMYQEMKLTLGNNYWY